MQYPEIEGRLVKGDEQNLIVGISVVEETASALQEALAKCQGCEFSIPSNEGQRLIIRTAWIRCEGVGGNISVLGRGGTRVGRKISEIAPCEINPAEVKQKHFRGER